MRSSDKNFRVTMDSILTIQSILDAIATKPTPQEEATEKLRRAVKEVGIKSPESFLKKVSRFDQAVGRNLSALFAKWLDRTVDERDWQNAYTEYSDVMSALDQVASGYMDLKEIHKSRSVRINIGTTPLLNVRFWPDVLVSFKKFKKNNNEIGHIDVHFNFKTKSSFLWVNEAKNKFLNDLLLAYYPKDSLPAANKARLTSYELHRCLIAPVGHPGLNADTTFRTKDDVLAAIEGQRVSFPYEPELIFPSFRLDAIREQALAVDVRRSQFEMHSYVQSGLGLSISHVEFLDETEDMRVNAFELPPWFGDSALTMMEPTTPPQDEMKSSVIQSLRYLVEEKMREMSSRYQIAKRLTDKLRKLPRVWIDGFPGEPGPTLGSVQLRVTPNMRIKGFMTIRARTFDVSGSIRGESGGWMELQAVSKDGSYHIAGPAFRFQQGQEAVSSSGDSDALPLISSRWVGYGKDAMESHAGVWVIHGAGSELPRELSKTIRNLYKSTATRE